MNKTIRELMARKATDIQSARALNDKARNEDRDLTAEELVTFDQYKASADQLQARIDRETALAMAEAQMGVVVSGGAMISVEDNAVKDGKRGFKTFGEYAKAVAVAGTNRGRVDQRLSYNAAAPSTAANEAIGSDGGFAIPPDFAADIWRLAIGEGALLPQTSNTELTGNSMLFPKDESTPWGGSGVQAYWQQEAAAGTVSKPVLSSQTMVLHKLMVLVPVTNELMDDGFAVDSYMAPLVASRILWKANEALLFGDGVGKPFGALNNAGNTGSPAVVQAKESGQATQTLTQVNISKMLSRLLVGELGSAFWLATPDILPVLESMTVGQYPIYLPNQSLADAPYGLLRGRPLVLSEHAAAFSSQSDISLISLRGYRTITKAAGLQTATSMHLYFDADALAFRTTFRLNGAPIMSAPVTPPKSSVTRSHFVTLGAR